MKFYNRNTELEDIKWLLLSNNPEFIYIYGRRRIWKTTLVLKSIEQEKKLYFFVWEKTERELLNDFTDIIKSNLDIPYINFLSLRDILNFIFNYSKQNKIIVIFDEFQNFFSINKSIFSDFQYFWDISKNDSKIKLFCLWSHFTLMKDIFENNKNPLFWRKTASFYLKNFDITTQVEILRDKKQLNSKNLLYFFSVFYWIPKYIEVFFNELERKNNNDNDLLENILDVFVKDNSFFIFEWKELFALEFWKSYDMYFSILSSISSWYTKKSEISNYTWISIDSLGQYLQKLEKYFELIERILPITETKKSKVWFYKIKDSFLKFYFRYILKYDYLLRIKDFDWLKSFIRNDISNFLWFSFEDLTKQILIQENLKWKLPFRFEKIWVFFDKKWLNEIDLVLLNSKEKKVLFIECKLSSSKIDNLVLDNIKQKVINTWIYKSYKKYYWFSCLEKVNIDSDYNFSLVDYLDNK